MSQIKRAVRRARRRLKQLGLDVKVVTEGKRGYLIIPVESIVRVIDSRIGWRNHRTELIENKVVIEVWVD